MSSSTLTSRLARLARRLGLRIRDPSPRAVLARAARQRRPVPTLAPPAPSIFWGDAPPLHLLCDLPRSALSGPTQEDKAQAHAALVPVVERQVREEELDLRQVQGLCLPNPLGTPCPTLEAFAATPTCRHVRIISYKDFTRAINQAIPGYKGSPTVALLEASWLGDRLFWAGDEEGESFACAVAYARLRGLDMSLPCRIERYRINPVRLQMLRDGYHVLLMPAEAWEAPEFMHALLEEGIPYARLRLQRDVPELLLLDRNHPLANVLGIGLKRAGAQEFAHYLRQLG